jgi:2-pyrone-4,6-dicarboxylate lactonase
MSEGVQLPPATPTPPHFKVPANACDSHIHLFDFAPKYKLTEGRPYTPAEADLTMYRSVQRTIGTNRVVFVHTNVYDDHSYLIDVLRENKDVRGISLVTMQTSDEEVRKLHECGGVRGVRITTRDPKAPILKDIEALCQRIAPFGWHLQLHVGGAMLVELAPRLRNLPVTLVIDHLGRVAPDTGPGGPEFKAMADLVERDRVWVKLSGPMRVSHQEPPYDDVTWIPKALVALAPERMLWGSDWPNINLPGAMPDAGMLLDCLATWVPDEKTRNRILVDNPAALYGF